MDPLFRSWSKRELLWLPERGMGWYPIAGADYGEEYFRKYEEYAATEMGIQLTTLRRNLVDEYTRGEVLDVGIGCGAFIEARGAGTFGYDINPVAVDWLKRCGLWLDPTRRRVESATFWDSLEHIPLASTLIGQVERFVFASLPIFRDAEHVLRSKHFRRAEHCLYWTRDGLIGWMCELGFECIEHNTGESLLGRQDVHTFVFRRRDSR